MKALAGLLFLSFFSSSAFALVQLPLGLCTLEGKLILNKRTVDPKLALVINEGYGGEKTINLSNANDPRLKEPMFFEKHVKMKIKVTSDALSSRGEGEFVELIERVPSFDIKTYGNKDEIAAACEGRSPSAVTPKASPAKK